MPGISRVIGPKAKNQQIFKSLKCGLRYLCVIAFFQQLDEICQIATTLIITVSSWHYTLASFWRYKAKIKILFFCEPSLWVEVSNDVLVPGFHCAYRASRGCNQQIFIRGDFLLTCKKYRIMSLADWLPDQMQSSMVEAISHKNEIKPIYLAWIPKY